MAYELVGFNLTSFSNASPLVLNFSTNWVDIQAEMIQVTLNNLGAWYGFIVYSALLVLLFWAFTEQSPFSTFRYSYLRALTIALCIVSLLAITMLTIGYIQSFRVVAVFVILSILSGIFVIGTENQQ